MVTMRLPMSALLALIAVPFAVTGLFRAGASNAAVAAVCAVVFAALVVKRKPLTRWAAAGWVLGCVAYAIALALLFQAVGTGLEQIG